MEFSGRKALVTGSAKGLGRQIALDLAREGADVAVHYRSSKEEAEAVAAEIKKIGRKAIVLQADVTVQEEARRLVDDAAKELGGLDILVNNVGGYLRKGLGEYSAEEWNSMLASDLNAALYCTQAALLIMRRQKYGRIINIGVAGSEKIEPKSNTTAYSIAKMGTIILTKTVAKEEAGNGITCNVVSPGIMENSVVTHDVPMRRPAKLSEVSRAVLFFASEKSGYITGQNIEVAGGYKL